MRGVIFIALLMVATPSYANDWEKFYRPLNPSVMPAQKDPELITSSGDTERDLDAMFRKGYTVLGFSSFNSPNSKTGDAVRFAKKLKASHLMILTHLESTRTASMPLTLPTTSTAVSNGNVSAYGSGGYASGNYSGTTTTYGSQTTYIPITISRFDKAAVYFGEAPKGGLGILGRDLTPQEIARLETRRAFGIRFVRDGSPAYVSDILPGDIIVQINGAPADPAALRPLVEKGKPFTVLVDRSGLKREITVAVPDGWLAAP